MMTMKKSPITKLIESLQRRYKEDTERWRNQTMPDNVKRDRKKKRDLLKKLKSEK